MGTVTEAKSFEVGDALSTKARQEAGVGMLECSWCGEEAWPAEPRQVAALAEHCTYEHGSHVPILSVKRDIFIEGNLLALMMGAPAPTEAEEVWREGQAEYEKGKD